MAAAVTMTHLAPPVQGYVGFGGLAWPGLAKLKSRYSSLPSLLPVGGSFHVCPSIGRVEEGEVVFTVRVWVR